MTDSVRTALIWVPLAIAAIVFIILIPFQGDSSLYWGAYTDLLIGWTGLFVMLGLRFGFGATPKGIADEIEVRASEDRLQKRSPEEIEKDIA